MWVENDGGEERERESVIGLSEENYLRDNLTKPKDAPAETPLPPSIQSPPKQPSSGRLQYLIDGNFSIFFHHIW